MTEVRHTKVSFAYKIESKEIDDNAATINNRTKRYNSLTNYSYPNA